jgi:hypothetical protein
MAGVFERLPPELRDLIFSRLPASLVLKAALSSKKMYNRYMTQENWVNRAHKIMGLDKDTLRNFFTEFVPDYHGGIVRFIYYLEDKPNPMLDFLNERFERITGNSTYESLRNIHSHTFEMINEINGSPLNTADKSLLINQLEKFADDYIVILNKQYKLVLFWDFYKKYKSYIISKRHPQFIKLPNFWPEYLIYTKRISMADFKQAYLERVPTSQHRKLRDILDNLFQYDCITFDDEKYFWVGKENKSIMSPAQNQKYLIPNRLSDLFKDYNIEYAEDLDQLYGFSGGPVHRWAYENYFGVPLYLALRTTPEDKVNEYILNHGVKINVLST